MKKGFTLVEVLGILVILSLILIIIVPNIMNTLKKSTYLEYESFLKTFSLAAETYVENNRENYPQLNLEDGIAYINISTLIDEGLIKQNTINPKTNSNIENTDVVVVTKNSNGVLKYTYSTEKEYVQDYLILHYDGINNTGIGHSTTITTWKDLSENNNNSMLNSLSINDNSVIFNGNGYLNLNKNFFSASEYTIEVVFDKNQTTNFGLICNSTQADNGFSIFYINNSYFRVDLGTYQWTVNYTINNNEKNKLTLVRTNSLVKMYVNGTLISSTTNVGNKNYLTNFTTFGNSQISGSSYNNYFIGKMYNYKIYNKALSEVEINQNYEVDKIRFEF